jgi:hypothetical protein
MQMEASKHEDKGHDEPEVKKTVHVVVDNEDDGDTYHLNAKADEALSVVIKELYAKKLRRPPAADDRLRCESGGEDVLAFSALTFKNYLAEGHCPKLEWLFSGKSGGA